MAGFRETVNQVREWINIRIYDSKEPVLRFFRLLGIGISGASIFVLFYYHGFYLSEDVSFIVRTALKASLAFYLFKYLVQIFYSFSPFKMIKETKWEGLLMLFLAANIFTRLVAGEELILILARNLEFWDLEDLFMIFIQVYVLLFITIEIGKASKFEFMYKLSPPVTLILSFLVLIAIGTFMLMLPAMTVGPDSMPLLNALFTSTSASCITGLIVVDTATYFTTKGQAVIMILFQLGGLNIVSFASWFGLFAGSKLGIRQQQMLSTSFEGAGLQESTTLFRTIFRIMLMIELVAAILIFFSWPADFQFNSFSQKVFFSIFHAISAFNHAGFSTISDGLYAEGLRSNYLLHTILAFVIILGALGFSTLRDIFTFQTYKDRFSKPWKHLRFSSKISLYMSAILLLIGFVVFMVLEYHHFSESNEIIGMMSHAFFQSVTARSSGFNTVDMNNLGMAALFFMMILMFIGGSTGSTAGGIKTSTFAMVLLSAYSTIRGKRNPEIFKMTIPTELMNKAFSIFLFAVTFIAIGTFALSITDGHFAFQRILFEQISAFCTVGLSTGITSDLSDAGKIVLITSMFIGRVGSLSLFFALSKQVKASDYKYPKATLMVG
jgi:trk system potassium uptake protein TrkH